MDEQEKFPYADESFYEALVNTIVEYGDERWGNGGVANYRDNLSLVTTILSSIEKKYQKSNGDNGQGLHDEQA